MDARHSLVAWAKQLDISYPLLSDFYPQGKVSDLYGARHPAGMAERALFVVDKAGRLAWIHIHRPIGEAPDNEDLFDVLRRLG
jgi:mycoredoxin-dependent peroxiredoxin